MLLVDEARYTFRRKRSAGDGDYARTRQYHLLLLPYLMQLCRSDWKLLP